MQAPRPASVYRGIAVLAWNSFLLVAVANLIAMALLAAGLFAPPATGPLRYGMDRLSVVYSHLDGHQIEELLTETWGREYIYEPFVQHREAPQEGDWVNVDRHGFRRSRNQGPWPPAASDAAVFVYGGSTTFGYGAADGETVPSRLQETLNRGGCERPVRVYNFGRGNYYSEQERVLFSSHLAAEKVPAAAVFVDGLNEWKDEPKFTAKLDYLMREPRSALWVRAARALPLIELVRRVRDGATRAEDAEPEEHAAAYGASAVDRWLVNRRMTAAIAAEFGVEVLFVWQPVPTYQYDLAHHLFRDESATAFAGHGPLQHGYALLDARRGEDPQLEPAAGFLWLADLQIGRREPLYVDAAHYSAPFSREIAERIALSLAPGLGCGTTAAAQPE
ncbi:MAG: hypothetical protein ACE5EG_04760 [Thermoanaerobaculia bacterium]